jgi:hypothetical protein
MTSIPVLLENKGKEPEIRGVAPDTGGISVGLGVLWIVGTAAAWNVVLVAFAYLAARLLS